MPIGATVMRNAARASALRAVSGMDAHLLRDIGAPRRVDLACGRGQKFAVAARVPVSTGGAVAAAITMIATPAPALAADGGTSESAPAIRLAQQVFAGRLYR